MAAENEQGTWMVHYACSACSMTATVVVTPDSSEAWHDHMRSHTSFEQYRAWHWQVVPLPLG